MLRFIIPVLIVLLIDLYSFQAFRAVSADLSEVQRKVIYITFWTITVVALGALIFGQFVHYVEWPKVMRIYLVAFIFVIYLSKLFILPFLVVDDVINLAKWTISKFSAGNTASVTNTAGGTLISRSQFISQVALVAAGVPFLAFMYGMAYGGFHLKVRKVKLRFDNLPKSFHKLKVVQLSDIHSGSFVDNSYFERAIEEVNALKPDVIFFTGDLVNNITSEVYPFTNVLSQLKAPFGVYSVLGNHDYGDYAEWNSADEKKENLQALLETQEKMGWKLLLNESAILEKDGYKIAVAGVENWSANNRFPKYGDLSRSLQGIADIPFKILLSHDPSHWKAEVLDPEYKVDLTLSGHTHGMQFGVETKLFRWSPSQYFYENWAGLYHKENKYLYVNRGLGFIGYPGRAGIRPEITLIELHSA